MVYSFRPTPSVITNNNVLVIAMWTIGRSLIVLSKRARISQGNMEKMVLMWSKLMNIKRWLKYFCTLRLLVAKGKESVCTRNWPVVRTEKGDVKFLFAKEFHFRSDRRAAVHVEQFLHHLQVADKIGIEDDTLWIIHLVSMWLINESSIARFIWYLKWCFRWRNWPCWSRHP